MAVNPSILSALLRLLFMLAFASLLFSVTADALELTRNGKSYNFDVKLPQGVAFKARGVDRVLSYKGVDISVRLIQDTYENCQQLVDERVNRMGSRDYFISGSWGSLLISPKECRLALQGKEATIESTYTYLEICKCYAAMHVSAPNGEGPGSAGALVSSLAKALSSRPEMPRDATAAELIDPDWREAFDIFRKRNLSGQLAYDIYSQSTAFALQTEREGKAVLSYLSGLFGVSEYDIQNDFVGGMDWIFDVETGAELYGMSPQGIARSISSCYRKGNPAEHCTLNYHQEMGCRMTPKWVKLCSTPFRLRFRGIYDLCWGEPRGDMPMLPVVKENAERTVQLPNAGEGGQVQIAKLAQEPVKAAIPDCDDNDWRSFYAEGGNEGIPPGLLP
ncbi:MAG: hypothetical protein VR78_09635 [Hoeflea sp. BRH_c9]|nr:MAG: hypothetical protein VR78_09635 [Hoeflea sp. BRH_c9]